MIRAGRFFAWTFAVAFLVATVWYGLLSQQISVSDEPTFAQDIPFDQVLEGYDWLMRSCPRPALPHEDRSARLR